MPNFQGSITALSGDRERQLTDIRQARQQWQSRNDIYTRLCRRVTTTLSLNELWGIFAEELAAVIPFERMQYQHKLADESIVFTSGKGGPHRCEYRLMLEGKHYGEITLSRRLRFEDEELLLIEELLGIIITAVRNACDYREIKRAALTDALTALGNKRAFNEALVRQCALSQRHDQPAALILCDLDHFKVINDTWGHLAGDKVLVAVARELLAATRLSDSVYRIGGEEFAILLPHNDEASALDVAERMRQRIMTLQVTCGDHSIEVTASLGVARLQPSQASEDWVEQADLALYRAKSEGRNRVVNAACEVSADALACQQA